MRVGLAAMVAPGVASAHRGWSGYDASKVLMLTGMVQKASSAYPHELLMLDADGRIRRILLAPPSRMERRGLPAGSIAAGQAVTVEGYPSRSDPDELRAKRIRVEGSTVEMR